MAWSLAQTTRIMLVIACLAPARLFADDITFKNETTRKWNVAVTSETGDSHKFKDNYKLTPYLELKIGDNNSWGKLMSKVTLDPSSETTFPLKSFAKNKTQVIHFSVTDTKQNDDRGYDKATFALRAVNGNEATDTQYKLFLESNVFAGDVDVTEVFDINLPNPGGLTIHPPRPPSKPE